MSHVKNFQRMHQFDNDKIDSGLWQTVGRCIFSIENGHLNIKDGYVITGDIEWHDYSLKLKARAPQSCSQVQIWVGIRHYNRDYRYVVALRGGNNNHLYLARYGAEGHDKMLALESLDFSPVPGEWYVMRIIVAGNKIAVFINDEESPRIVAEDDNAPFKKGKVSLGGSYVPTEFDYVEIKSVAKDFLKNVQKKYIDPVQVASLKKNRREAQRQKYRPFSFPKIVNGRMEVSLDGDWLFLPDYQSVENPINVSYDDSKWHIIDVPNFWVPLRCWLEGETFEDGKFNKGQNDKFHLLEDERCNNYTFDSEKTQSAWYRYYVTEVPPNVSEKKIVLHFEGVAMISTIYLNGVKLYENIGMFGPFEVDISNHIQPGRNVIALHVWRKWNQSTSQSLSSVNINEKYSDAWNILECIEEGNSNKLDSIKTTEVVEELPHGFYQGFPGGIWKPVKLVITDKIKVEDFFFIPTLESAKISVWYSNNSQILQSVEVSYQLKDKASGSILCGSVIEKRELQPTMTWKTSFSTPKVAPKLWSPGSPNLYIITFFLKRDNQLLDSYSQNVGFRTIEINGNQIFFNGKPLWIKGANHMPGHIKPNDKNLAKKFMELALEHNVIATRTHCNPFSKIWMDAADEAGVMVSYEGTWPWLMLQGDKPPSDESIQIWQNDLARLLKANRNHPSIFLWTINNEMKFYLFDREEVLVKKGKILTETIKIVRNMDSSRPIVADSAYYRKFAILTDRYDEIMVPNELDDGDIDDAHAYYNWYEESFFNLFDGTFGKNFCTPERPMISQELSTGYPRSDDGLPTRAYLFSHQTPQTLIGKDAYEHANPCYFQKRHSMVTKELVEVIRRVEHETVAGIMPFAFETWFYQHHDHDKVYPMLTAKKLKIAFQPVLVSLELFGRHHFAGSTIVTKLTLINDSIDMQKLPETQVNCDVVYDGQILASQTLNIKPLEYYHTVSQNLELKFPDTLPKPRIDVLLVLKVKINELLISQNEYNLVLAENSWGINNDEKEEQSHYFLKEDEDIAILVKYYGLKAKKILDISELTNLRGTFIKGKVKSKNLIPANYNKIMQFASAGGKVILLNNGKAVFKILPKIVTKYYKYNHEIVTMNIKESSVFEGIEPLDLAWFTNETKVPFVAIGRFTVDRLNPDVSVLAETLKHHGYLKSPKKYKKIGGTPLFDIRVGKGKIRISQIRYDSIEHDPIAARLISNILKK